MWSQIGHYENVDSISVDDSDQMRRRPSLFSGYPATGDEKQRRTASIICYYNIIDPISMDNADPGKRRFESSDFPAEDNKQTREAGPICQYNNATPSPPMVPVMQNSGFDSSGSPVKTTAGRRR